MTHTHIRGASRHLERTKKKTLFCSLSRFANTIVYNDNKKITITNFKVCMNGSEVHDKVIYPFVILLCSARSCIPLSSS